jgi:hypothetical protein
MTNAGETSNFGGDNEAAGGDTMRKSRAIRRKTMSKKGISITVFLCLLAAGNGAYGIFRDIGCDGPETSYMDIWHHPEDTPCPGIPNINWNDLWNWSMCITPNANIWACIEARPPEPSIINGNAACSRLSIYPWSEGSQIAGEQGFALTVGAGAGIVNCGVQIGLCDKAPFDSSIYGYAVLNVLGGTMFTPGFAPPPPPVVFCPPSGLYIGGGPLTPGGGTGLNYGIVNMYGGSIVVPGIRINYGNVNLFGGLLYETDELNGNLIISQSHVRNKINIEGGELRLQGNRAEQVFYYYSKGRICPCNKHGILFVDYNYNELTDPPEANYTSVTAFCTPGSAWDPTPADRANRVILNPTLTWSPGDWVQATQGHAVYLGTDFDDVNDATPSNDPNLVYKGRQDANSYTPGTLNAGATYYWRIDEYKDGNPDSPWKGNIWQFRTKGPEAIDPKPASGAIGLPIPLQLSWTPGVFVADTNGHRLYFGTSHDDVYTAIPSNPKGVYMGPQDTNVFNLDKLDYNLVADTNYYWRVDEVNEANVSSPWRGEVWNFRNTNYFIVDDFESYASTADMSQRWNTQYSGAGGTLTLNEGTMQYDYNNSGLIYFRWSEARFDCNDGTGGADWTGGGALPNNDKARSLAISYIGELDNDADPVFDRMYVAIEDTAGNFGSIVNSDPEAQRTSSWKQWNVNLTDLNSPNNVSLRAVRYLYLGFGVRGNTTNPGGTGTVRFDDIRLYQRRCVQGYGPTADLTGDCRVNLDDMKVMSQEWLGGGEADIYIDGVVNFRDFAVLAQQWMMQQLWP